MTRALVLYIPVIHEGYVRLLKKHRTAGNEVYLLGNDLITEVMPLHKEIRALPPETIKTSIEALGLAREAIILHKKTVLTLARRKLIITNDEAMRTFVKKYFPHKRISTESAFLRWDEKNVLATHPVRAALRYSSADARIMAKAEKLAADSSDWWRQVGAVITKGGRILVGSYNQHVPSEHIQYIDGDPRDFIAAGTRSELSTALHAEQSAISEAARRGIALEGADIYVTAFPCPVCAKLVAYSGIKRCFFRKGVATLDGEHILKEKGVVIIKIK